MKMLRILSIFLALAVCVGGAAAYAADAYGYLGESAGIYIDDGAITLAEDVDIQTADDGTIASENGIAAISGVRLTAREIGDWAAGSASGEPSGGSGEASEASDTSSRAGQTGIVISGGALAAIGGEEDLFTAPDGEKYNTVVELWADDADEDNALTPGEKRSALVNDVETWPGVGLVATPDKLVIDNAYILTQGANRSALLTGGDTNTVIRDSKLVSLADGWILPAHICISRAARTALLTSSGNTWVYNSAILSDNWGTYSMDAADGIDHIYIINSYSENYRGGYGLYVLGMGEDYAQGNNHVYMYGSRFVSPQYGMIFDDAPYMFMGSMEDMERDEHAMDEYDGVIAPEEYLTGSGGSVLAGANNAAIITFDMHAAPGLIGKLEVRNSTLSTAAEDLIGEDGGYVGHVMDYDGDSVLNEDVIAGGAGWFGVNYVRGSVFWLRGTNADISLENTALRSDTGVLFQSTLDYTNNVSSNMTGRECLGIHIAMKDMDAVGDILHEDYQRKMYITLDGASLTGGAEWFTVSEYADRAAAFVAENYAQAEASKTAWEAKNGAGSSLLGTQEDILSFLVYDDVYDESLGGLEITLQNGAVWTVTKSSRLTKLTICEGCEVVGTVTVNGEAVEPVPGTYEGDIAIIPTAGAVTWADYQAWLVSILPEISPFPDAVGEIIMATESWDDIDMDNGPWGKIFGEDAFQCTTWDEFQANGGVGTYNTDFVDLPAENAPTAEGSGEFS